MNLIVQIEKKLNNFILNVDFKTSDSCLGILGASGCGKSMTLRCIAGIITPDKGYIELNGKVLFDSTKNINLTPQQRKVGFLFQNYALFPNMTVYENIGISIRAPKQEKDIKIMKLIEYFKLTGLEKQYPNQLSGGQQQRVALARMLAYEPELLLFDEPFSALDSYLKEELQLQLHDMLQRWQVTSVMVTHNQEEVYYFCKHIVVLDQGQLTESGDAKEVLVSPQRVNTARLTGCKNISPIEILSKNQVKALDWNLIFTVREPITKTFTHIGIRSESLKPCYDIEGKVNIIRCRISKMTEGAFHWNILLLIEHIESDSFALTLERKEAFLWWTLEKSRINNYLQNNGAMNYYVELEDILLLQ